MEITWIKILYFTFAFVRFRLHQKSASTLRQLCNDASNTVLIENNAGAPDWGCNPFPSDSIVFNENKITSVIEELSLMLGVNGP